jgi:hypothetical protein
MDFQRLKKYLLDEFRVHIADDKEKYNDLYYSLYVEHRYPNALRMHSTDPSYGEQYYAISVYCRTIKLPESEMYYLKMAADCNHIAAMSTLLDFYLDYELHKTSEIIALHIKLIDLNAPRWAQSLALYYEHLEEDHNMVKYLQLSITKNEQPRWCQHKLNSFNKRFCIGNI